MIVRSRDHHRRRPAQPGCFQGLRLPPVAGDQGHVNIVQRFMRFLAHPQVDRNDLKAHLRQLARDAHARVADADHDYVPLKR